MDDSWVDTNCLPTLRTLGHVLYSGRSLTMYKRHDIEDDIDRQAVTRGKLKGLVDLQREAELADDNSDDLEDLQEEV